MGGLHIDRLCQPQTLWGYVTSRDSSVRGRCFLVKIAFKGHVVWIYELPSRYLAGPSSLAWSMCEASVSGSTSEKNGPWLYLWLYHRCRIWSEKQNILFFVYLCISPPVRKWFTAKVVVHWYIGCTLTICNCSLPSIAGLGTLVTLVDVQLVQP